MTQVVPRGGSFAITIATLLGLVVSWVGITAPRQSIGADVAAGPAISAELSSIVRVQSVTNTTSEGTFVSLPIAATAGNLLVVVAAAATAGEISISDGVNTWYRIAGEPKTWDADGWYAKDCVGGPLIITVSGAFPAAFAAQVVEFSGANKTHPIGGHNEAPGGAGAQNLSSGASRTASSSAGVPGGTGGPELSPGTGGPLSPDGDYAIGWAIYVTDARIPTRPGTISSHSGAALVLSSQAFSPTLAHRLDEPQVDAVGADDASGLAISHGQMVGPGIEDFRVHLSTPDYVAYWAWVATIRAQEVRNPPLAASADPNW